MSCMSKEERAAAMAEMHRKAGFVPVDRAGRPLVVEEEPEVEEIDLTSLVEDPQEAASPPADGDSEGEVGSTADTAPENAPTPPSSESPESA